jgi:hypothetical protein
MADKMSGAETCGTRHQGDEVALEADALYIRISRNQQILGICFVPCVILADDFVEELLNEAKELAEWQTLFADVIRASEDSDDTTLDVEHFNRWQQVSACCCERPEESGQDSWALRQRRSPRARAQAM